jgi:hypothetical protein
MLEYHFLQDGQVILVAYHFYKRCFSIRDAKSKRILGYADHIVISDVKFIVHQSGRMKVLKEKKKNVHAYVKGQFLYSLQGQHAGIMREAYYNPYRTEAFVDKESAGCIQHANLARCVDRRVYYSV